MKKIIALLVALVMVFALCACGQTEAAKTTTDSGNAGSPTQDMEKTSSDTAEGELKVVKMGLAMNSMQAAAFHAWADYLAMRLDYEAEARGYKVELTTLNAENDVTQQANDIKDLIAQGCEVIFCPCLDSEAILQSVSEVHAAGLIYVSYCREVSKSATGDQVPDLTVNFASEDQAYAGMVGYQHLCYALCPRSYYLRCNVCRLNSYPEDDGQQAKIICRCPSERYPFYCAYQYPEVKLWTRNLLPLISLK